MCFAIFLVVSPQLMLINVNYPLKTKQTEKYLLTYKMQHISFPPNTFKSCRKRRTGNQKSSLCSHVRIFSTSGKSEGWGTIKMTTVMFEMQFLGQSCRCRVILLFFCSALSVVCFLPHWNNQQLKVCLSPPPSHHL